ncbi:MAG: hypothetical protein ACOC1P_03675 [Minisyncoccales bacterium]
MIIHKEKKIPAAIKNIIDEIGKEQLQELLQEIFKLSKEDLRIEKIFLEQELDKLLENAAKRLKENTKEKKEQIPFCLQKIKQIKIKPQFLIEFLKDPDNFDFKKLNLQRFGKVRQQITREIIKEVNLEQALKLAKRLDELNKKHGI